MTIDSHVFENSKGDTKKLILVGRGSNFVEIYDASIQPIKLLSKLDLEGKIEGEFAVWQSYASHPDIWIPIVSVSQGKVKFLCMQFDIQASSFKEITAPVELSEYPKITLLKHIDVRFL